MSATAWAFMSASGDCHTSIDRTATVHLIRSGLYERAALSLGQFRHWWPTAVTCADSRPYTTVGVRCTGLCARATWKLLPRCPHL